MKEVLKQTHILEGSTRRELLLIKDITFFKEDYLIVERIIVNGKRMLKKLFDLKRGTINNEIKHEIEKNFHLETNKKNERLLSEERAVIIFDIIIKEGI